MNKILFIVTMNPPPHLLQPLWVTREAVRVMRFCHECDCQWWIWVGWVKLVSGHETSRSSYTCLDTSVSSPSHHRQALCGPHKGFNSVVNCCQSSDGSFYNATSIMLWNAKLVVLKSKLKWSCWQQMQQVLYIQCTLNCCRLQCNNGDGGSLSFEKCGASKSV